jgi:hypothetical protein
MQKTLTSSYFRLNLKLHWFKNLPPDLWFEGPDLIKGCGLLFESPFLTCTVKQRKNFGLILKCLFTCLLRNLDALMFSCSLALSPEKRKGSGGFPKKREGKKSSAYLPNFHTSPRNLIS